MNINRKDDSDQLRRKNLNGIGNKSPIAPTIMDGVQYEIVAVHGVGEQLDQSSARAFVCGVTKGFEIPQTRTRAQLAGSLQENGEVNIDGLPFTLRDFNYASEIEAHLKYSEEDPRKWIGTFRLQLEEMNRKRHGPRATDFAELEKVTSDIVFSTTLARMIAERLRLQTGPIELAAYQFLQQVQLYVDREQYRDSIEARMQDFMLNLSTESNQNDQPLLLFCHSLGTVVAFRTLLAAAASNKSWVRRVRRLVTFGSPLDLIMLLYPKIFKPVPDYQGEPIEWINYNFGNDPIATDLAITRQWVSESAPKLFLAHAPDEVHLGKGSMVSAHTDYWTHDQMYRDVFAVHRNAEQPSESDELEADQEQADRKTLNVKRKVSRRRPSGTLFGLASIVAAMVAAWLSIVWWEENLKAGDADRVVLGNPLHQIGYWIAITLMVLSHMYCWNWRTALVKRLFSVFVCFASASVLFIVLPGQDLAGFQLRYDDVPFPVEQISLGNLVVFLVPLAAFAGFGFTGDVSRSRGRWSMAIPLVPIVIILSLLIGKRDNPSNAGAEFALLSLTFGFWWLGILLMRIHYAYKSFIGGREHLDLLADLWKVKQDPIPFRSVLTSRPQKLEVSSDQRPHCVD